MKTTIINRKNLINRLTSLKFKSNIDMDRDSELLVHFNEGYAYMFGNEHVTMVPCSLGYSGTATWKHLLASLKGQDHKVAITWSNGEADSDRRSLTVVNGSQTIRLNGVAPNLDVFNWLVGKNLEWYPVSEDFLDCVDTLETTVSKNRSNSALSSIHCSPEYFESASNIQICRFYHKLPDGFEFLIPCGLLKGIKPAPTFIARTEQFCHFKYDRGLIIAIRFVEAPYLKTVAKKIEEERQGHLVRLPATLLESIKTAEWFADEHKILTCTLRSGEFLIKAGNGFGRYIARARVDYTGDEVSFKIGSKVLCDVLKFNQKCLISDRCIKIADDSLVFVTAVMNDQT